MDAARCSRRAFLTSAVVASGGEVLLRGASLSPDPRKFRDPATEFEIVRLTEPTYRSLLPPAHLRSISQRNNHVLFSSDRDGTLQPFRTDTKSGEFKQLGNAKALDPSTLS